MKITCKKVLIILKYVNLGPPKSCLEIQQQGKTEDANYQISIKGKIVNLYCYAMNTKNPQEYVNLRDRNYAVIHSSALGSQYVQFLFTL